MRTRAWLSSALLIVALPWGVSAQLEAGAFAGAFLPLANLTNRFGSQEILQSHDPGIALGARVGTNVGTITIEGSVAFVPTNLTTEAGTLGVSASSDQTLIMANADVLFNLEAGDFFEPFFATGVGVKKYSQDDPATPPGFEAGADVSFNVGLGGRLWLTETTAIRVDLRDYISRFDAFELIESSNQSAKLQNDVVLTVGLSIRPG